jgi:hypothetical protein
MEMDDSSGLKFEFQGFRLLPIKCVTERLQQIVFDLLPWRPLRLCESHCLSDLLLIAPRPQRKILSYFSELGVLCAFARVIIYPIP